MPPISQDVLARFNEVLKKRAVPESFHGHYRKWLRYFLDFCAKYQPPELRSEQVRLFVEKLWSKKETPNQLNQAAHDVSLFFESQGPQKVLSTPVETIAAPRCLRRFRGQKNSDGIIRMKRMSSKIFPFFYSLQSLIDGIACQDFFMQGDKNLFFWRLSRFQKKGP